MNRLRVRLCAWLTLCPTLGFFPHTSHILDIVGSLEPLNITQRDCAASGKRFAGAVGSEAVTR